MDPTGIANLLVPLAGMVTGAVVVVTVGRVIRHWVDRHYDQDGRLGDPGLRAELERIRGEVDAVRDLAARLGELEERVDFAERVLAQRREGPAIGPGG